MERIVQQGLLYDFYGELLTEHQRYVYEEVVIHDLSLSEIAQELGISRQGVHDLIKRCDRLLEGYEKKLGLVGKFQKTKQLAKEIQTLLEAFETDNDPELLRRVKAAAGQMAEL